MAEVFNLCVDITELGRSQENGPCVLCEYCGHVNWLEVCVYPYGYHEDAPKEIFRIFLGRPYGDTLEDVLKYLSNTKERASTGAVTPDVDAQPKNQLQDTSKEMESQ